MKPIPQNILADNVVPLFDKVIISREQPEKVGSVLLPESAQKYMSLNLGRIAAVGHSVDKEIQKGDLVLFGKNAGDWQKIPGSDTEIFVCLDVDIWAKIEE